MSSVYQNLFPDPHWVNPLLRDITKEFRSMVKKMDSVCLMIFELQWSYRPKIEIEIENRRFPEILSFPKWDGCKKICQWEILEPVKNLKFNEKLFRKYILKQSIKLFQQNNCYISFEITLFGSNKSKESCVFTIK